MSALCEWAIKPALESVAMQSHYSLNIAIRNNTLAWGSKPDAPKYQLTHFARVDLGSDRESAIATAREFAKRFPASDLPGGFALRLTYWSCIGEQIDFQPEA
jgi:hypothetical protein